MPIVLDQSVRPEDRFISAFEVNKGKTLNGKNASIASHRQEAIERFEALGIPTNKLEAWKYTNIAKVLDRPYMLQLAPEQPTVVAADIEPFLIDGLDAHQLVFVNGRLDDTLSNVGDLPSGVVVMSLEQAGQEHPDLVEEHYGEYADMDDEALTALNTAFVQDGPFVYVPSGTVVEKPIFVLHVTATEDDLLVQPRGLFVVEDGGIARIVEAEHTLSTAATFTNYVTEAFVGENGNLDHYVIQDEGDKASRVQTLYAEHRANSVFDTHTVTLSGEVVRNNLTVTPNGTHCESHLFGLYLGKDESHVDNHTLVDHVQPDCFSNELYKHVLNDASTGVFNGKVFVRRDSQRINAYQSNKSIVLTDEANIYTKPELEIYADDVQCSHGATTGQLDEEAIFYLRSRGLTEKRARILMLRAFAGDVIDEVKIDALREHLDAQVAQRFESYQN
jgi:Fe-S cluster assembly protein SufD